MLTETQILNKKSLLPKVFVKAFEEWRGATEKLTLAVNGKQSISVINELRKELAEARTSLVDTAVEEEVDEKQLQSLYKAKKVYEMRREEAFSAWALYQKFVTETSLRHKVPSLSLSQEGLRLFFDVTDSSLTTLGKEWEDSQIEAKKEGKPSDTRFPEDLYHVTAVKFALTSGKSVPEEVLAGYPSLR